MKKLIVGLLASFMVAAGLVAFSSTPATAACPYTACIKTTTKVSVPAKIKVRRNATVSFRVAPARSGNAAVRGSVTVTVKRDGGGFSKVIRTSYTGGTKRVRTPRLTKTGRYGVRVVFTPARNSIYKASVGRDTFRVVKR
jgi:hypothetical protein